MNHADLHLGRTAGEGGIQAAEIVLDQVIFLVPGGLVADGSRVISFGFSCHGGPSQMVDADRDTEGSLPVTCQLMAAEIKIPVGNAVEFAEHTLVAKLMDSAFSLLGSGQLSEIAEHIDAGKIEGAVGTHSLAESGSLGSQGGLLHHMTGKGDSVLMAPAADVVGKGVGEALTDMVMIVIAVCRYPAVGKLPDTFREGIKEIGTVSGLVGLVEIVRVGQDNLLFFLGKAQGGLVAELRFVGKDRRNRVAEGIAELR